ncbi:MAG: hypothetical protein Q8P61_05810 [Candidatus Nanopelagicales bacterium]|nr:hypothetical protein [Candidatus Nanopelagicales bacterium]
MPPADGPDPGTRRRNADAKTAGEDPDPGAEATRVAAGASIKDGPEDAGPWNQWGPYLSERAWGTVREDYSDDGDPWSYFPYEHSRSRAYRWGEDGLGGICDIWLDLCFAVALWNGRDDHLKERLFGLNGHEGNHGEDVKECYWYRDATPSHSWLQFRYHYPQQAFPYDDLITENARRGRNDPEYELVDTGVFDDDRFWVVDVDYAKADPTDTYIRIRVTNAGPDTETIHVLPQLWFRDTWSWGPKQRRPEARHVSRPSGYGTVVAEHWRAGVYHLDSAPVGGQSPTPLFCDNATNVQAVWGSDAEPISPCPKDGIGDHVVRDSDSVSPQLSGTKSALWYQLEVPPGETAEIRLRLWSPSDGDRVTIGWEAEPFDQVFTQREAEADEFYSNLAPANRTPAELAVLRQAFAGMIWTKQFYRYQVRLWLDGDPNEPPPPPGHRLHRNANWRHVDAYDVLSMPDKWEYPWFAAWDLAFHAVVFAHIDPAFAKYQLTVLLREWYMHPNGALPAYEWSFDDRNPPVHAWAALRVYEIDGNRDHEFLAAVFQKLLINFTWWVNRVDAAGNNVFQGGFLGLDNIGPINRTDVPAGCRLEQADGTSWMAFYCLMMLRIALRLASHDGAYRPMMLKFLEHFVAITDGITDAGMWDPEDGFFYDQLVYPDGTKVPLRVRSVVGMVPVFAAAYLESDADYMRHAERIERRFSQFLQRRGADPAHPNRAGFVSRTDTPDGSRMLLSVVDPDRLRRVLLEALSEDSMLGPHGIRSMSRRHLAAPFRINVHGEDFEVGYEPAESTTGMYGGNSNWRGPIWFPINHMVIEALERYHMYLGDEFRVECPTGSGQMMTLLEVADELRQRLVKLFLPDESGRRPGEGHRPTNLATNPRWQNLITFHEYFDGDTGAGLGASHQTGWTGLVADLIMGRRG